MFSSLRALCVDMSRWHAYYSSDSGLPWDSKQPASQLVRFENAAETAAWKETLSQGARSRLRAIELGCGTWRTLLCSSCVASACGVYSLLAWVYACVCECVWVSGKRGERARAVFFHLQYDSLSVSRRVSSAFRNHQRRRRKRNLRTQRGHLCPGGQLCCHRALVVDMPASA